METVETAGDRARRAARSQTMERLARFGLVGRGLLFLLIGWIALQIALGNEGEEADDAGALSTIAEQPFGAAVLWLMVVGFAALGAMQLMEALFGGGGAKARLVAASWVAVFGALTGTLLMTLLTGDTGDDSNEQARDLTAWAMQLPVGRVLVGVAALVIIGVGGFWFYKGVSRKFLADLHVEAVPARARTVVKTLGTVGLSVRGVVVALLGIFVGQAAITYDPDEAKGVDATLRAFADTAAGGWLLAAVAAGVLVYAAYCFCEARWRKLRSG